jgi:hypothetical protein
VTQQPRVPPAPVRHSALQLWHLLSLDAPTVAAVWTFFVARCCGVTLPWASPAAMFAAVWMIYAADRLLDARALDAGLSSPQLEERHRFHHRHRGAFLAGMLIAALALVLLLPQIDSRALALYALLATLLATWMLVIHVHPVVRRLPKELAVGIFFPAACFIPTVARAPWLRLQLLPTALVLAGACALNCLFLYAWEHPSRVEVAKGAHWTTRWATRHLVQLSTGLAIAAIGVAEARPVGARADVACAISAGMLLALHGVRDRFKAVTLRAAADLVLLTPLLFLFSR